MKSLMLAMSMVILLGSSCKKDKKEDPLSVDQTELILAGYIDETATIQITTNTHWKISVEGSAEWLSIEPTSGQGNASVQLTNKMNNYSDLAEATLTLSADGSKPITIKVSRKPLFYKPALSTLGGSSGEEFLGGAATADGGYILVGSSQSEDHDFSIRENQAEGYSDGIAVKYSATGSIEWKKMYGGSSDDQLVCVAATEDGGFIMAGNTTSINGDFSGRKGGNDYWILKVDKNGIKQWNKVYGSPENDYAHSCVAVNGGYIVTGTINNTGGNVTEHFGLTDAWIIKLNTSGEIIWKKTYGGSDHDAAKGVVRTADGHCVFAGNTGSSDGNGPEEPKGSQDAWLLKFDSNTGDKIWSKRYGGSDVDVFYHVNTADNGELIAVGMSLSNDGQVTDLRLGEEDGLVAKTAADGELKWASLIGGADHDRSNSVVSDGKKGFVVAGYSFSQTLPGSKGGVDALLSWLDQNGKVYNSRMIGSNAGDFATLLLKTTQNRFVAGGAFNAGNGDFPSHRGQADCWSVLFE